MRITISAIRFLVAVLGAVAIVATFLDTASRATINPFNFFGYFTMQSNILTVLMLLGTALIGFAGKSSGKLWTLFRACVTTYIVIVGVVYNTLLTDVEGGISLDWANTILHLVIPIYVAIDWILIGDREPIPWSRLWAVAIYPIVWIVVVLVRGATDGWVPYPFLDPSLGYSVVAIYCVGIAVAIVIVGALVWAISRLRLVKFSR
ncbi:MAG: Pr6Pr family membrane protein [Microbacteriaceae bacterium]|nr:Pr6Pr family membrane protein [Microbacteriaceae bacterium]MCO5295204.1 Pr6Pr family membrane protein [Homoserinimonas sp.]MCW5944951.1 Pr6Pr family membrane protein [Cryobacterium sp.]